MSLRTLLVPPPLVAGEVTISGDEAHHGRCVLRLATGDALRVADGHGRASLGTVGKVGRHALTVRVGAVETIDEGPAALITVAVALPRGDRAADLVRGLVELGVGAIEPLACERAERLSPATDRLRRVCAEALKQCRRARLPAIGPHVGIPGLAARGALVTVLDRCGGAPAPGVPRPLTLVIGPEGGLTAGEGEALRAAGATAVRLAGTILRIETAALAAAAVWVAAWEHHRP